ncbi:MAG: glycine cleavage system aminomethyltransferase GcvT [Candidatus Latescibacterota bacterium]|nr:glycine cleavage system aminomethyltransferase GcvT [Candidatus Latescibacterota bacterium]
MSSVFPSTENQQSTSLFFQHQKLGAKFSEYAGWTMPIYYDGIRIEHHAVVNKCGLFDVSHMGQIFICGSDAIGFIRHLLPFRFSRLSVGNLQYTPMCNSSGGTIDDLIIYRLQESEFLLIVNAARTDVDWGWIQQISRSYENLDIVNRTSNYSLLAIQGPTSKSILGKYLSSQIESLRYYDFIQAELGGVPVILSRNGYTGEDGFEIIVESQFVEEVWALFICQGVKPCGLASRDILRMEMGFALYGNELSEDLSPLEGGIGWTIDWSRTDEYIGGEILREQRSSGKFGRLCGIEMLGKGIPRQDYEVFDDHGTRVGIVTSGTQSPTLKKGIALARLHSTAAQSGCELFIDFRGKMLPVRVKKLPFRTSRVVKSH